MRDADVEDWFLLFFWRECKVFGVRVCFGLIQSAAGNEVTTLLLRFWEPAHRAIRIGGVDIREMDYDTLLDCISIVMQNVILFSGTVEDNIRLGKKDAPFKEIVAAAKKAMIHDFITTLPQGYRIRLGENGKGLSGGQKQRISTARSFLKDVSILILDEVTSNVDPVNEAKVQRAISSLGKNRTVLVIAHHLRTVRSADTILVLDRGRIVQHDTHDTLTALEGGCTGSCGRHRNREFTSTGCGCRIRNNSL